MYKCTGYAKTSILWIFLVYYNWKHAPELPTRVVCIFRPSQATGLVFPSLYTWPLNKHCSVYTDSEYMHWALYTNHCLPAPPTHPIHTVTVAQKKNAKYLKSWLISIIFCIAFSLPIGFIKISPMKGHWTFQTTIQGFYILWDQWWRICICICSVLYLYLYCIVSVFVAANDDWEGSVELCLPTSV